MKLARRSRIGYRFTHELSSLAGKQAHETLPPITQHIAKQHKATQHTAGKQQPHTRALSTSPLAGKQHHGTHSHITGQKNTSLIPSATSHNRYSRTLLTGTKATQHLPPKHKTTHRQDLMQHHTPLYTNRHTHERSSPWNSLNHPKKQQQNS